MAQYIKYNFLGRDVYDWNIEEFSGYKPISTYYFDFGLAEPFGEEAIRDTYDGAVKNWGTDIKWMTEIVMVLNWKIWEHHYRGNRELSMFYDDLWREAQSLVLKKFKGDDLSYYYRTVD